MPRSSNALLIAFACLAGLAPGASARGLETGFAANDAFRLHDEPDRLAAFANARAAGASVIRLNLVWRGIAPPGRRRPAGFDPMNPASAGYNWREFDRSVAETVAGGLSPIVTVTYAPDWAEGRGRPRRNRFTRPGSWKPDPRQLAQFMHAAATRYSGAFPDPARPGQVLPRVPSWQVWNEPNLWPFLQPQYTGSGKRLRPFAPRHYARMLSAATAAVHAVDPSMTVVMGGLAPFGDPKPQARGARMAPVAFARDLFCVEGRRLRKVRCGAPVQLDAYAHHPYSVGGPTRHALNRDDATVPDLRRLARVFRAAERAGTSLPRRRKPIWATELGWDTNPPTRTGVSPATQARWLQEAFYLLWKGGASLVLNLQIRDDPRRGLPGQAVIRFTGLFYRSAHPATDRAKPSLETFRFPFVVDRASGARGGAWGLAPCAGACDVVIERRAGSGWRTVATVRAGADRVFRARIRLSGNAAFRARTAELASRPYTPRPL
ncbi:MAG: hypothetical protein H0V29_12780 [Thermoleophilaceae bacterium]|nr:hypothetical protein [Thermoleophilaceae bacterium]